jgi:hypothetical protein
MPVNFVLSHLDANLQMDLSGVLDAESISLPTDVSAVAVFQIGLAALQNTFKFQSDAFDISNAAASDVQYYVDPSFWPTGINIAHAMLQGEHATGATNALGSGYDDNRCLLKHDFVRYLALKLFNTVHGVDLFSNETELLNNIVEHGNTIKTGITTKLTEIGLSGTAAGIAGTDGSKYLTNATTGTNNLGRIIMQQLAASAPERFAQDITNSNVAQSMPFRVDDALYFKVTVKAAAHQNDLTGVGAIDDRVYHIKLLVKASPTNVAVTDSASFLPNYPGGPSS